jgi:formate dehydrogenase (coenzyme F420) beta subunit
MSQLTREIREAARKLLREKKVDVVIGFEQGSLPLRSRPCFIRKEEDAERLVWDGFCETNLARYLPKRKEKAAIVAKGCDSRAIVELIKENQIVRDQVVIIGVPCKGMIDRSMINKSLIEAKTGHGSVVEDDATALLPHCKACTHPDPLLYDLLVGETNRDANTDELKDTFSDVEAFGALDEEARWAYLSDEVGKCIRCYACRNACPLCYCPECFVDASQPRWVGKSTGLSDTMVFHLVRAFHLAGRCVACGACERACPVGVDIRKLNRKLQKDVKDLFNHEAGLSLEEVSPLASFRVDDPEPPMVDP